MIEKGTNGNELRLNFYKHLLFFHQSVALPITELRQRLWWQTFHCWALLSPKFRFLSVGNHGCLIKLLVFKPHVSKGLGVYLLYRLPEISTQYFKIREITCWKRAAMSFKKRVTLEPWCAGGPCPAALRVPAPTPTFLSVVSLRVCFFNLLLCWPLTLHRATRHCSVYSFQN